MRMRVTVRRLLALLLTAGLVFSFCTAFAEGSTDTNDDPDAITLIEDGIGGDDAFENGVGAEDGDIADAEEAGDEEDANGSDAGKDGDIDDANDAGDSGEACDNDDASEEVTDETVDIDNTSDESADDGEAADDADDLGDEPSDDINLPGNGSTYPDEESDNSIIDDEDIPLDGNGSDLSEQLLFANIYTDSSYITELNDGAAITLTGAFPEGATVKAYPVYDVYIGNNSEDDESEVAVLAAYDIKIFDANGEEFQPGESVIVSIYLPVLEDFDVVDIYHIEDGYNAEPELVAEAVATTGDVVEFEAASFSTYAVAVTSSAVSITIAQGNDTTNSQNWLRIVSPARTGSGTSSDPYTYTYDTYITDSSVIINISTNNGTVEITDVSTTYGSLDGLGLSRTISGISKETTVVLSLNRTVQGNTTYFKVTINIIPRIEIATVDSTSKGVNMYMFNYLKSYNDNNGMQPTSDINSQILIGGQYGTGETKLNLVKSLLGADGYPVTTAGVSLAPLFSATATNVADYRKKANHLFYLDEYNDTGYFHYDSALNYAQLDQTSGNFTVYNHLGSPSTDESKFYYRRGNFMPYNTLGVTYANRNLYDEYGRSIPDTSPRYNEPIFGIGTNDFYFGMYISANFYQPKDGVLGVNQDPMIFQFTGDDDMWVFINDVLVLDIGGVHDAQSGYIDFSTGEVRYTITKTADKDKPQYADTINLRQIFSNALGSNYVAEKFYGNTFKNYEGLNIKVFYMERGAGASNLKIRFNLPTLPKGNIAIVKDVQGVASGLIKDQEFKMQLYVKDVENPTAGSVLKKNEKYAFYNNNGIYEGDRYTDENGVFILKNGEKAEFSGIKPGDEFYVIESGLTKDNYQVHYILGKDNGDTVEPSEDGLAQSQTYKYDYDDPDTAILTVRNIVAVYDQCSIKVTKSFMGELSSMPDGFSALFTLYEVDSSGDKTGNKLHANYPSDFTDGSFTFYVLPGWYILEEKIDVGKDGSTPQISYSGYTLVTVNAGGVAQGGDTEQSGDARDGVISKLILVDNGYLYDKSLIDYEAPDKGSAKFENYYGNVFYDITLRKLSEDGVELLDGAEFILNIRVWDEATEKFEWINVHDEITVTNGEAVIENLQVGKFYRLKEIKAPAGYVLPDDMFIYFTIGIGGTIKLTDESGSEFISDRQIDINEVFYVKTENNSSTGVVTHLIVVKNIAIITLPEVGGIGTMLFTGVGLAVAGGAFMLPTIHKAGSKIISRRKVKPNKGKITGGGGP